MRIIINGNLHRLDGTGSYVYVNCPFVHPKFNPNSLYYSNDTSKTPCGRWCALFEEVDVPKQSVVLHCGQSVIYQLAPEIKEPPKE